MGVVYRALDPLLNRYVAVKVMSQGIATDQELRDRFLREARAAGSLQHPNIITIFDFGDAEGSLYIAMEYVEGSDLSEIIQRQDRLPLSGKLDIIIDVLRGLDYAHSRGVVHRDVKPANIRVSVDGHAKLMDFGIARLEKSDLTRSGMMIGTPDYMAPEQVTGGKISPATDVFAIGVVLYEFLANRPTFDGETLHQVLYKVVSEQPPPLRETAAALPPSLQPILDKALAKDPTQRYQSAGAMAWDLSAVRTSLSGAATIAVAARATPLRTARLTGPLPSGRKRRPRLVWIGAGAGVMVLGVGAVLLFGTRHPRPQATAAGAVPAAPAADPSPASPAEPPGAGAPPADSTAQAPNRVAPPGQPERGAAAPSARSPRGAGVGRPAVESSAGAARAVTPSVGAAPAGAAAPAGQPRADTAARVAQPVPPAAQPAPSAAAAPQAAPSPPPAEEPADSRAQLEALVAAYASAIEARSVPEIRGLYPGMTGPQQKAWEQFFSRARAVKVRLSIAQLDVNGATADLTVTGGLEYVADGLTQHQPMRFQATAAQLTEGWRLRTLR